MDALVVVSRRQQPPEDGGAEMTEDRPAAESEYRRHIPATAAEAGVADRVDAVMDAVQAPPADACSDRPAADTARFELRSRHHPVLLRRDSCDHAIGIGAFCTHVMQKAPMPAASPRPALRLRGGCEL